jgi:hypothetical protein
LKHNENKDIFRPLWLLVLVNIYFWLKLLDYLDLYIGYSSYASFTEILRLSINIPVYLMVACYIFKFALPFQTFWRFWIILAVLDEFIMFSADFSFSNIDGSFAFTYQTIPLYILGFIYAYKSKYIWENKVSSRNTLTSH